MPSAERRERKKANAQAAREARQKAQRRSKQLRTARNVAIAVAGFVVLFLVLNALLGGNDDKQATDTTAATTPTGSFNTMMRLPGALVGITSP